jgi:hypothetical protein
MGKLAISYEPEAAPAPTELVVAPAPVPAAEARQQTVFSALLGLAASLLFIGKGFLF